MPERRDLVLTPAYAIIAGLLVLLSVPAPVGAILLAPLVLFAPGYALVLALEIPREYARPGRRYILAVTLSMASVALGGLVLNALFGLTQTSWALWLVGLTCGVSLIAAVRHRSMPRPVPADRPRTGPRLRITWAVAAAGAVTVAAVGGAAALTEVSAHRAYDKPVTQLSLLPAPGTGNGQLRLAVTNLSGHAERVTLTVTRGARTGPGISLVIGASRTWSRLEPSSTQTLTAALTRPGRSQPFSEVAWTGA